MSDSKNKRGITELELVFENINTILRCSNATPIRAYEDSKYFCAYCKNTYKNAWILKQHSLNTHANGTPSFLETKTLSRLIVHMDVTLLKCIFCEDAVFPTLQTLVEHLKAEHFENFYDIKDYVVSYKFEGEKASCAECLMSFDEFADLQAHALVHNKNYKCEFCDSYFLNRSMAIEHKNKTHKVAQKI